nr:MAG TPA: hypothetical protein [Caudoviricetes sp.]
MSTIFSVCYPLYPISQYESLKLSINSAYFRNIHRLLLTLYRLSLLGLGCKP